LHGAKSDNGAWWMPILEKGASKFFVNYDNLYAGWSLYAFRFLTNMPTLVYYSAN